MWEQQLNYVNNFQMDWNEIPDENIEDIVDADVNPNYDYIMEEVKARTLNNLPATLTMWVESEIHKYIQE